MYSFLGVFISGGIGSVCRWLTCEKINFHWGTMLVNVLGAFLIGCAYAYCQKHLTEISPELKLFIMTGFLGGFTTFSTYLLNFSTLINSNNYLEALLYLSLSILIGLVFLISDIKFVEYL